MNVRNVQTFLFAVFVSIAVLIAPNQIASVGKIECLADFGDPPRRKLIFASASRGGSIASCGSSDLSVLPLLILGALLFWRCS